MSVTSTPTPAALERKADAALQRLLQTAWDRDPFVVANSPPGAGKSTASRFTAAVAVTRLDERVAVACQTNVQGFDFVRELAKRYRSFPIFSLTRNTGVPPDDVLALGVQHITDTAAIPNAPCVVVGTSDKWMWRQGSSPIVDRLIVDECFQLRNGLYARISGVARRHTMVGDLGQIEPVVPVNVRRWAQDPMGPHVPAPLALMAARPGDVTELELPATRRLPADSAALIQRCFYPELEFGSTVRPGRRALRFSASGIGPLDPVLDRASEVSLVWGELPHRVTGEVDGGMVETIRRIVERLLSRDRGATVLDRDDAGDDKERPIEPRDIGVVCPHNKQEEQLRLALAPWPDVYVETANSYQGLQRRIVIAWHPLSGRSAPSEFHFHRGRLCVELSRHRVACILLARAGVDALLDRHELASPRCPGVDDHPEWDGLRANRLLFEEMREDARVIPVPEP